jgi:hypothetical protein
VDFEDRGRRQGCEAEINNIKLLSRNSDLKTTIFVLVFLLLSCRTVGKILSLLFDLISFKLFDLFHPSTPSTRLFSSIRSIIPTNNKYR